MPIKIAVIIDKEYVAKTFWIKDFKLKTPIMRSLAVLAIYGLEILPLRLKRAGIIKIRIEKLLKGNINKERIKPARIEPIMLTISDGNASLTILHLVCFPSINLRLS